METGQGVGTGAETGQGTGPGHGGISCVLQTQFSSFFFYVMGKTLSRKLPVHYRSCLNFTVFCYRGQSA